MATKVKKSEQEWREQLTPEQYEVTRKGGTERAFTGPYVDEKSEGMYRCVGCGAELFSSDTKFDSGTGWPSFTEPGQPRARRAAARQQPLHEADRGRLQGCDAHLGHVFDDGPGRHGRPALLHQRLRPGAREEVAARRGGATAGRRRRRRGS